MGPSPTVHVHGSGDKTQLDGSKRAIARELNIDRRKVKRVLDQSGMTQLTDLKISHGT
jgi:ribosomal protein S9